VSHFLLFWQYIYIDSQFQYCISSRTLVEDYSVDNTRLNFPKVCCVVLRCVAFRVVIRKKERNLTNETIVSNGGDDGFHKGLVAS
jgi:hypothetical protein